MYSLAVSRAHAHDGQLIKSRRRDCVSSLREERGKERFSDGGYIYTYRFFFARLTLELLVHELYVQLCNWRLSDEGAVFCILIMET